jgi:diaminopropionate ammonia-lyase
MQLKEQNLSDVTHCIVPVGVGSLAHSAVQYYKSEARPKDVSIITVEPATAACLNTSLHKGKRTSIQTSTTIMQGLNCGTVSSTAWPDLKGGVEVSTIVEEDEALLSVSELESLMIRVGPCGAATLAAARKLKGLGNVLSKDSIVVLLVTEGTIA